jgi:hypothetical protein
MGALCEAWNSKLRPVFLPQLSGHLSQGQMVTSPKHIRNKEFLKYLVSLNIILFLENWDCTQVMKLRNVLSLVFTIFTECLVRLNMNKVRT